MPYMHLYTSKTHKKGSQYKHIRKELFQLKCTRIDLRLLEFQKSPRGECSQTPLAVHALVDALVHIKNTGTKGSQYKHIGKAAFLPETAPELISDC